MNEINFEFSFKRLEQIVDKINSGTAPLDEMLRLYEEADGLIVHCQKKLSSAEEKIEILLKTRENKIALDSQGEPMRQPLENLEVATY